MDAKDLRTETVQGDTSKDVTTSCAQTGGSAESCVQAKTYQDAGSSPMGKAEAASSRPCAVIGPDRVIPPPESYHPPEYSYKPLDYHHPTRNISPRQTFQENMQRIMVPPSYATTKLKEDDSFQIEPDISSLRNNKLNLSSETKYCEVPYIVNPIVNDLKNFRTSDVHVSNTSTVLPRSATEGWPLGGSQGQSTKPYGASGLYPYPEYQSGAASRAMFMPRPHRTVNEVSGLAAEPYYHEANIRFKPYPTAKDRFSRYDYIGNYGNAPPLSSHKSMPSNSYPGYPQVPLKYMDTRMSDPVMNPYQRPNPQTPYNNVPFQNSVIHPSYGPIQGNCLQSNKCYPCPDTAAKSVTSNQMLPYPDYESSRPKPYPMPDGFYDITRPHLMKSQVMPPNYPAPNMHVMHPHPYYRKDSSPLKNHYDHFGHYRNMDPSINLNSNPLPRFSTQFSNTVPMPHSDLISNNPINVGQPPFHDDFGYINQSLSANTRSYDSRFANDPYRRYEYNNYGPVLRPSSMQSRCEPNPNNNQSSKDKKNIDVRQFLQMWNEGEEESNENNTKDSTGNKTPTFTTGMGSQVTATNSDNQEQLYVMGIVNVPSEELSKYEHIQKVSKLPENIKGYNSIEILHKFEEVIESSNLNDFKSRPQSIKDYRGTSKNLIQFQGMMEISMPTRPMSPLDVEAKITQSVIHKDVGCNFEIKPCSPPVLNLENTTSVTKIVNERAIEKATNPVMPRMNLQSTTEIGSFSNDGKCQSSTPNRSSMKTTCCKMNGPPYPTSDNETSSKPNYSLQDLESNSGVCLASLPRLDNDIELSFPEVNQQFINANKVESVIISTPPQDLPPLEVENHESSADEKNLDICRDIPKLDKHKKLKRKIAESFKSKPERQLKAIRTDSVIIKNPETYKTFEDCIEQSSKPDFDENLQKDPMNLTFTVNDTNNDGINRNETLCDGLAIDFSLNSTDRRLNIDQCKSPVFNDHKDSYDSHEVVEYNHDIPDSKVDIQGTDMTLNRSLCGDIEIEGYPEEHELKSTFPIVEESTNLENDLPSVYGKTDSVGTSSNSNDHIKDSNDYNDTNIEKDLCDLKEQSLMEQPFLTSGAIEAPAKHFIKDEVAREKDMCITETKEVENVSIVNNDTKESCSFNTDSTEIADSETNTKLHNVFSVSEDKNELEQKDVLTTETKQEENVSVVNNFTKESYSSNIDSKEIAYSETNMKLPNIIRVSEEKNELKQKDVLTTETIEEENLSVVNNFTKESYSSNIDSKEIADSETNTKLPNIISVSEEKNGPKQKDVLTIETKEDENVSVVNNYTKESYSSNIDSKELADSETNTKLQNFLGVPKEKTELKQKDLCTTETKKVENVSVVNKDTEESFSSNIDSKKIADIETNRKFQNVLSVSGEKHGQEQTFFGPKIEIPETEAIRRCMENADNTEKQSKYSATLSDAASEETNVENIHNDDNDALKDNVEENTDKCSSTENNNIIMPYEEHPKENQCSESATSALSTLEKEEMLQGSQNLFFDQPLTPMDITPESSLIQDDTDDCNSRDEIVNMDSPDNSNLSLKNITLFNNGMQLVHFSKEMLSPWMRKLVLYQSECCMLRVRKCIPSQIKSDTVRNDENFSSPKDNDISKNGNSDDVIDMLKENYINLDSTASDLNGDTETINGNKTIHEQTEDTITDSCMNISCQSELMSQNSSCFKTIVTGDTGPDKTSILNTETLPINFSPKKDKATHILNTPLKVLSDKMSNIPENIEKQNSMNLENSLESCGKKVDAQCSENLTITKQNDLKYFDGNFSGSQNDDTSLSDKILSPNGKTLQSIEDDKNTNTVDSGNSLKLMAVPEDTYCGDDSMILKQSNHTNFHGDFPKNDSYDIRPSDIVLIPKLKVVSMTGGIDKMLPGNCLDAIKNEYASDSEESYADNEVDRIKQQYASDSDEIIEDDIKCLDTHEQDETRTSTKVLENIIQRENFASNKRHYETEEFDKITDSESITKNETSFLEIAPKCKLSSENEEKIVENLNETIGKENRYIQNKTSKENQNLISTSAGTDLHEKIAIQNDNFPNLILSTEDIGDINSKEDNVSCGLETQEFSESGTVQLSSLDFGYRRDMNFLPSCSLSTSKSNSLKRSFSDSDLSNFFHQSEADASLLQQTKRRKIMNIDSKIHPETISDSFSSGIQSSRRNSLSSICNDSTVSFCILIENASLLAENCSNSEKIQCITEITEDCLSCVQTDPIVSGIDSAEIVSFVEEMNEYSNNFPTEDCIEQYDGNHEESWVDDVACVETVVSEDIAEDIIISASTPLSELSNQQYEGDESDILSINDHSDKIRYIYGDKMCSNDAQLLETLYRTPQMNVNKKLVIRESQNVDDCSKFYDRDALEKVLSESSSYPEVLYEPESVAFNTSSLYPPGLEVLENDKENISIDTFSRPPSPFDGKGVNFTRNEELDTSSCEKTQDDTVHSCESSIDNVFSYSQREDNPKCIIPSSPEVSSTTTEDKNSTMMLKITNLSSSRVSQSSEVIHNRISCKYTETNDYLNTDIRIPSRPLITKAAQKYIPPLKETIPNLKVKLTLPQHSLLRLKKLKAAKDPTLNIKVENRPNVVNIENVPNIVSIGNVPNLVNIENKPNNVNTVRTEITKKVKPKFEDVLKSIEETQFQMHRDKSKKTKKPVPKVVIKKIYKGSHYASTSNNNTTAPDLTGRKWQPWVFLERSDFIDKMALNRKIRAVYNHRKRTFVLAETFKKYKSSSSTEFVISKPKLNESSSGRLKYTIRLKHYC